MFTTNRNKFPSLNFKISLRNTKTIMFKLPGLLSGTRTGNCRPDGLTLLARTPTSDSCYWPTRSQPRNTIGHNKLKRDWSK